MANTVDAKSLLVEYKRKVDKYLEDYFASKSSRPAAIAPFLSEFQDHIAEFTLRGGKRLRPALVYYGYRLFSDRHDENVVKLSIFMELLQSFFLIHDDIFDRSPLRRGKPTVHKTYMSESLFKKDLEHSALVMAILAGDVVCQFAYEMVSDSEFTDKTKTQLVRLIAEKVNDVLYGQVLDYVLPFKDEFTEEDVFQIDLYKTATYTYELPLMTGAILAGRENGDLEILRSFARPAGIAFQLRDDILGMFGDEDKTGKLASSDIAEGKKTLLVLKAYDNATTAQKQELDRILGKRDLTEGEAQIVRDIVSDTGSLDYSKKKCGQYVNEAHTILGKLSGQDSVGWQFLNSIVEYMIVRDI